MRWEHCDNTLSRFDRIPERDGQIDGRTDRIAISISRVSVLTHNNKKLSCRRETARHFLSLNNLLSHSRSLKVIQNYTVKYSVYKSLLVFHWNYVCISYRLWNIQRQKWRDLETGGRDRSMTPFDRSLYDFILVGHCNYSSTLYHFRIIWCWMIVTLKSG